MFALSEEGTKQLQEGTLMLSSGGLRKPDGSLYEMATPVCFASKLIPQDTDKTVEEVFKRRLKMTTARLDKTLRDMNALKDIAWINYAVNCRTYEMTYQGFQRLIGQLDDISAQLSQVDRRLDNKEFNECLELANKYKNKLKSIAGFMEIKNFNPTKEFLSVAAVLDEIAAYFERLYNELKTGTSNNQAVLESIVFLLGPYTYLVRRYSALFYYDNESYPPNYEEWVEAVSKIIKDARMKNKFQYYLRVNLDCSLEDVYIALDMAMFNLRKFVEQIDFDRLYVLQHSKEEYLSIDRQLKDKIEQKDYQIINGHLCIEL